MKRANIPNKYIADRYVQSRIQQLEEMHVIHKKSLKKIEKEIDGIKEAYRYV